MGRQGQTQATQGLWWLVLLEVVLILWGFATPARTDSSPATVKTDSSSAMPPPAQEARHFLDVGLKRFREHDVAEAIEAFTKAIELNPKLSLAYYARAKAHTGQKDVAGAMADYTKAVEVEPGFVNAYYFRGLLRAQQGERTGAIADFTQVLELDPRHTHAAFQRGLLRAQQGERDGAIADFTQTVDGDPYNSQALSQRGLLRAQQGDRAGAIQDLQGALKLGIPSPEEQAVIQNTLRELEQ